MNNRTAFAKAPNEKTLIEHNLAVVERPNHHCGDDFVLHLLEDRHSLLHFVVCVIWPSQQLRCQSWTVDLDERIQAFEIKCYMKMVFELGRL